MGSICLSKVSPCSETPPSQFEQLGAKTSGGVTFEQEEKENQDRVFCVKKTILIQNAEDEEMTPMVLKICGVCDGHGRCGAQVSELVCEKLPFHVFDLMERRFRRGLNTIESVLKKSMDKLLSDVKKSDINISYSGCTLLFVLVFDGYIYTCNIGDSRAVLARKNKNNLEASPLSVDHSVNNPKFQRKILASGGTIRKNTRGIFSLVGEYRESIDVTETVENGAILKNGTSDDNEEEEEDSSKPITPRPTLFQMEPANTVGDIEASKNHGISSTPEITKLKLDKDCLFVVLGSDGIFSVFENVEVVEIAFSGIAKHKHNLDLVCETIIEMARKKWKEVEDRIDDISVIIALLQDIPNPKTYKRRFTYMPTIPNLGDEISLEEEVSVREIVSFQEDCSEPSIPNQKKSISEINKKSLSTVEELIEETVNREAQKRPIFR